MKFYTYAAPTALGLLFSFMGITFAMTGGYEGFYLVGGLLASAYVGTIAYVARMEHLGKGPQSAYLLALPMFMVTAAIFVFQMGMYAISQLTPDSEIFIAECKTTKVEFIKSPTSPVRSIAYEWDSKIKPPFIRFEVSGTRITAFDYTNIPVDVTQGIDFIETKTSFEGHPKKAPAFLKYTTSSKYFGVDESTADVVVHYHLSPEDELRRAYPDQGLVRYELTVIDRRTSEKLASKIYFVDARKRRACGPSVSDHSFILTAIGKQ